jgi:hypothetical protein
MALVVETHNTGDSRARWEIVVMIEQVLSDKPGDWHVSIFQSPAHGRMTIGK